MRTVASTNRLPLPGCWIWSAAALVASVATLLAVDWLPARAGAALLLAFGLPGALAARLLLGGATGTQALAERSVVAAALGPALAVPLMLALAYLQGGVSFSLLLAAFAALVVVLIVANHLVAPAAERGAHERTLFWALVAVIGLGALLRLTWLGYSEFQGDEARVLLRAGDLLLGYENTPFVHQKPPGELLLVAALYGLSGAMEEWLARLPFALANLAALAGAMLLGRRLLGNVAGLVAALLLAVDGYLVAFGRIVQYQSVIFLCSVAVLLLLASAVEAQRAARAAGAVNVPAAGRLWAAALIAAGGLLFHYEMAAVALPSFWLLWRLNREGMPWARLGRLLVGPVAGGAAVVLLFALPFLRHPEFARAFAYVADDRLGGAAPYNNLLDVAQRSILYSGSAFVLLQAAAMAAGVGLLAARRWGWRGGVVGALLAAAALAVAVVAPSWITVAGRDLSAAPLAILLIGVPMLPGLAQGERAVWLWFGPLAAAALAAVAVPHSHVYTFFIPLAFVSAATVQALDGALFRRPLLRAAGWWIAAGALVYVALWPALLFADAPAERLRRWDEAQPRAFWYPFDAPPALAIFGFPLRNGWKAAGMLVADRTLADGWESNARPEVADWYTRGVEACPAPARLFFLTDTVEPTDDGDLSNLGAALRESHTLLGRVLVGGDARMAIWAAREGGDSSPVSPVWEQAVAPFRAATRTMVAGRRGAIPAPQAATRLEIPFADGLRLAGVTLPQGTVAPGGMFDVTLEWEALRPMAASYTVFLHLVDPATNTKVGQRDSLPVCGRAPTWRWNAGDRIADPHRIEIFPDAAPGTYRLLMGLYTVEDGIRLPTRNADGSNGADSVDLGPITVR